MSSPPFDIQGPTNPRRDECEAILRSLPEWFGIEASLVQYTLDVETLPTFVAQSADRTVGVLTIRRHFPQSAEVHLIAVHREFTGRGIGARMLTAAENWLARDGVRFLQVKTLSESSPDHNYARTRKFYLRSGFTPLEEMPLLWSKSNPCLIMIKRIDAGAAPIT